MKLERAPAIIVLIGAFALAAAPSAAAANYAQEAVSENWSGYVAGASASGEAFSSVSGSWIEPTANCSGNDGYSAFWVGLGGAGTQSQSLEQVGTQADCASGSAEYYAWYELVPSGQQRINLQVRPGDHLTAGVTVVGTSVKVTLDDHTTGASATRTSQMTDPDTSSAEWIAEAPSTCDGAGDCEPLPLADFGTVTFTGASATADGHTGPISDPGWSAQPVELAGGDEGFVADQASATAQPSELSSEGSSFSVAWQASGADATSPRYGGGYPGGEGGYGSGGYGDGGYGSGGYGNGSYGNGGYGNGNGSGGYGNGGYGYGGYGGYGYPGGFGASAAAPGGGYGF